MPLIADLPIKIGTNSVVLGDLELPNEIDRAIEVLALPEDGALMASK